MTMHLIKFMFLPMVVVLLNLAHMTFCTYSRCQSLWSLYDTSESAGSSPPKTLQSPTKTKQKAFGYACCVQIFSCKTEEPGWRGWLTHSCLAAFRSTWDRSRVFKKHETALKASFVDG